MRLTQAPGFCSMAAILPRFLTVAGRVPKASHDFRKSDRYLAAADCVWYDGPMLRAIVFFGLATSAFASATLDVLVNAAASFSATMRATRKRSGEGIFIVCDS
jgi:hypothetical protein